jgi:hypothetical protein
MVVTSNQHNGPDLHTPITQKEVAQALHDLHPNKSDWTPFEVSNMERALFIFWTKRKKGN